MRKQLAIAGVLSLVLGLSAARTDRSQTNMGNKNTVNPNQNVLVNGNQTIQVTGARTLNVEIRN